MLVLQSSWQPISTSIEYLDVKWWDRYSVSEYPCFYEQNAVELLAGDVKTDWILENDDFTDKKHQDGDDIEGLMASYYEVVYTGKDELNCSFVVSPFTRWWESENKEEGHLNGVLMDVLRIYCANEIFSKIHRIKNFLFWLFTVQ